MKFLVLLLVAAIAVNTKGLLHGDKAHKLHKAWAEHKAKHHPELNSPEEEHQLKVRFVKTNEMIHKHNSDPNVKQHFGHNQFSTMTNEEKVFYNMFGIKPQPSWQSGSRAEAEAEELTPREVLVAALQTIDESIKRNQK